MENIFTKKAESFFKTEESLLILGDCFENLKKIKTESIDMIFEDPP